ncbi:MAG TPA: CoA-binding protein [Burkholderiaceae bacterium]|nr:CoA-binding protein [Burkholderiaceae bacterium]
MVDLVQIFNSCKTIAIVGLSPKLDRASYGVAHYMQEHGYRIIPINPNAAASNTKILGEKSYISLEDAAKYEQIEMVNCFRNSIDIPPIADAAIAIGAKVLWMQLGIENTVARKKSEMNGLTVIENLCLKIEHRRLKSVLN